MNDNYQTPMSMKLESKKLLDNLLLSNVNSELYRSSMVKLGELLGEEVVNALSNNHGNVLVISTAEDADFLQKGVSNALKKHDVVTKLAVFWNNHYQLGDGKGSVAPIIHKFLESGYENVQNVIIVKSVISGSCVVRTNLIELLDEVENAEKVFVVSPVMYKDAEKSLRKEFPDEIANKFNFISFRIDGERASDGEVIPGIGGQVYQLLGIGDQPALNGYMPDVVKELAF
jgi:hypothetical protein